MHDTRFRPVIEASYLTTENTARYRTILHFMYREYKQYHNYLDAEEILVYMQSQPFEKYSDKELQADLKQLVEWNNLIPRQETGRVFSVEDFNKRRFRYQCTEYTIRIEARTIGTFLCAKKRTEYSGWESRLGRPSQPPSI